MVGGFMGIGTPEPLMDELVLQGRRELTVIANDTAAPGIGIDIGKLVTAGALRRVVASHIGLNPETQRQMIEERLQVSWCLKGGWSSASAPAAAAWAAFLPPPGSALSLRRASGRS